MNPARKLVSALGRWYCRALCRAEHAAQAPGILNERPAEYGFVFRSLLRCRPTTVLDVGTGAGSLPHLMSYCGFVVTATDNVRDYWTAGMFNRHFHVVDDDITHTKLTGPFDLITCVSVLEHIARPDPAVGAMRGLLKPGGHLVFTFPYNERQHVDNAYGLPGATYGRDKPYICQMLSREDLSRWAEQFGLRIVEQEYWRVWAGEFWAFGERVVPPRPATTDEPHHLSCVLLEAV